jgi:hypothetical protein
MCDLLCFKPTSSSIQAAEGRLHGMLEERNWFYLKFKEELEQNNTDMKKLQQLMELEKSNDGHVEARGQMKNGIRSPVGSSFSFKISSYKRGVGS